MCSKEGGGGVGVLKAIVDINLNAVLTLPFRLLRPIYFSFTPFIFYYLFIFRLFG